MTNKLSIVLAILLTMAFLSSCKKTYTPKPMGYSRIDFPEKAYSLYNVDGPYKFEIPEYAIIEDKSFREPWWVNIVIPDLNGTIHISYKAVDSNLDAYIEDSRTLVYKHTSKASGIEENPFYNETENKYGIVYELKGDAASAIQFFITDSTRHFLRGSLYFNAKPNRDSLNPVIDFLREDVLHLIESTTWNF